MNYRDPLAAAQARNEQLERELIETRAQAEQAAGDAQVAIARASGRAFSIRRTAAESFKIVIPLLLVFALIAGGFVYALMVGLRRAG